KMHADRSSTLCAVFALPDEEPACLRRVHDAHEITSTTHRLGARDGIDAHPDWGRLGTADLRSRRPTQAGHRTALRLSRPAPRVGAWVLSLGFAPLCLEPGLLGTAATSA